MPILKTGHVEILGDAKAHAGFDSHACGIGVRGPGKEARAAGIIVTVSKRIITHGFDLGRRDSRRSRVPNAEESRAVTSTADFCLIANAGRIAKFLIYRRRIRLQSVTARTTISFLGCSYSEVAAKAEFLTIGVCS